MAAVMVVEGDPAAWSMAKRRVSKRMSWSLSTFSEPNSVSVTALSQQSPLQLIELSILKLAMRLL
jgi:hypothetical protein